MNTRFLLAVTVSLLTVSAFAQQVARPPPASSITRARVISNWVAPVQDLSSYVTRPEARLLAAEASNGSLGNRIGTFRVSSGSYESQISYIRSKLCILGTSQTNDNETLVTVAPIAGPFTDGTTVWRISADYRPDLTSANCYFNGNAGIFNAIGFQNYDNINSATTREFSGFYARTRYQSTQVDFITGETKTLAASYSGYEYVPCETSPYSQQCAATRPPDPCAPYAYDSSTGSCYDPNAGGGGGGS